MKTLRFSIIFLGTVLLCHACKEEKKPAEVKQGINFSTPQNPSDSSVIQNGISTQRYPNGKKKLEGYYRDGKRIGLWMAWYESGILWSQGNYHDGKRNGYSALYYPDGKIRAEGTYSNNQRSGQWTFYNESGIKVKTLNYDHSTDSIHP